MILTCPECASRYVVDDARVGPQGRTVRCANCSHAWKAMPPAAAEPPLDLTPAAEPAPVATDPPPQPRAAAALPKKIRARHVERQRTRKAVAAGAVWGVLGACVLALTVAAALLRVEVVKLWPRTAGAYARVGLPVNPTGLSPENVQAAPGLKDGHAAVIVTGQVRNVETAAQQPMPLKVSLLDKHGKALVTRVAILSGGRLAPGQTRPFSVAFLDPPSASADVQVEFAIDALKAAHGKPAHPVAQAPPPKLRGSAEPDLPPTPIAKAAEPLPADSPYALPPAAHEARETHEAQETHGSPAKPKAHSGHDG